MKLFINTILIILVIILQMTLIPKLDFFNSFPNLILLISLSLLFINRLEEAVWWLGIGGILLDLISPIRFGVYTISMFIIFAISYSLVKRIFYDPSIIMSAVFFFVTSLILDLIFFVSDPQITIYFTDALYSALLGCIIYSLLKYYYKPKETIKI